jgi:hypothetical protein
LENVHDITRHSVVRAAKELDLKRKKLDSRLDLVQKRRSEFRNDAEGQALKRFVDKAATATKAVKAQLPGTDEIRGLLISGDD